MATSWHLWPAVALSWAVEMQETGGFVVWQEIRVPLLDIMYSIYAAIAWREMIRLGNQAPPKWPQSILGFLLTSFGGSVLMGVFLGQPALWMASDRTVLCALIAFFALIWLGPISALIASLLEKYPFKFILSAFLDIVWCKSITVLGQDLVQRAAHEYIRQSITASVLLGTLSGLGVFIVGGAFRLHMAEWSFGTPPVLRNSRTVGLVLGCNVMYYVLCNPHSLTIFNDIQQSRAFARALVLLTLLVFHTGYNTLTAFGELLLSLRKRTPKTVGKLQTTSVSKNAFGHKKSSD